MIDQAAVETALREWVVDACAGLDIPEEAVIFGHGSAPRPVAGSTDGGFATIHLTSLTSGGHDDVGPVKMFGITAASNTLMRFTIAGDHRDLFPVGGKFVVVDSSQNDGEYTVTAVALGAGPTTLITVLNVLSAVADGKLGGVRLVGGHRECTVDVNVFGPTALARAEAVRSALQLLAPLSKLRAAGLAPYAASEVRDLTGLLETERQPRAQFDVRFGLTSFTPEYVGAIESVELREIYSEADGTVAYDTTETIEGP